MNTSSLHPSLIITVKCKGFPRILPLPRGVSDTKASNPVHWTVNITSYTFLPPPNQLFMPLHFAGSHYKVSYWRKWKGGEEKQRCALSCFASQLCLSPVSVGHGQKWMRAGCVSVQCKQSSTRHPVVFEIQVFAAVLNLVCTCCLLPKMNSLVLY